MGYAAHARARDVEKVIILNCRCNSNKIPAVEARGTLVLIVGPSGVGKDTLLDEAKKKFAGDNQFVFARRHITRSAYAGSEDHEPISPENFERYYHEGGFMLNWQAHGMHYGVSQGYADRLVLGKTVIVNVSRTILNEARRHFQPLLIINITASPDILKKRLLERGREDVDAISSRLNRVVNIEESCDDVVTIHNDGSIVESVNQLYAVIANTQLMPECIS